jgi:hypothetical protein
LERRRIADAKNSPIECYGTSVIRFLIVISQS